MHYDFGPATAVPEFSKLLDSKSLRNGECYFFLKPIKTIS
jgi:hypothetical protein